MALLSGHSLIYQRTSNGSVRSIVPADGYLAPNYHVTRWEGLPLTSADSALDTEDGPTAITETIREEDEDTEQEPLQLKAIKMIKILIPHVILISMLLSYLSIGAIILQRLETQTEVAVRTRQLVELQRIYSDIAAKTWSHLAEAQRDKTDPVISRFEWDYEIKKHLQTVSANHEWHEFDLETELENYRNFTTKWTFPTALLYALTVLTTCGYGEVDVMTDGGKIFAVGFALVGIPLMFITAADIGKFLSETLLRFVAQGERFFRQALWCLCRRKAKEKAVETASAEKDVLDELADEGEVSEGLWFPIGAYVSLICLYCSLGAMMFKSHQEDWSFIHAFHFSFNLIVTVGLGDIVVENLVYLWMIVAYVIIGLSVVTMCVDLASTHLKAYFTKIHYYGQARSRFLGMSEDIREMVQLISAMRKKKGGGKVTWNDVRQYMEMEAESARAKAFIPRDIHKLRYVDETSSAMSTIRHNSATSDNIESQSDKLRRFSSIKSARHEPPSTDREFQINLQPPAFL